MRLVYLGTSDFAATVLRRLAASEFRPVLVVTPPDRRRGRGRRVLPPPAADAAGKLGIELHQTENVNADDSLAAIRAVDAELGFVCAFGQILRPVLLDELELLNVHPSLLPRWRGAAPIERALMAGDEETGVGIMRVTEGLDSGPVALSERVAIEPQEDFGSLSARLAELGGDLAVRALELRGRGELRFAEQDDDDATYAEKIQPVERRLDPTRPAAELERVVRALTPHVGAYLELVDGERLGIRRARAAPGPKPAAGALGSADGALALGCAEGTLLIDRIQPPGKREMDAAEYLRGHVLPTVAAAGLPG